MFDSKEYTKLRDIAQKRIKRAQQAGVPLMIHVPTVKQLRQMGEHAAEIEQMRLQQFLQTGFSLERSRIEQREPLTESEKRERKRQQQRDYRRRRVAREHEREEHPKTYQGYVKGLKTLGVDIPPSKLPAFFAYMDYRFAQGGGAKKYVFDIFVDDYVKMLQKGYQPNQILDDFRKFEAEQAILEDRAGGMTGMSYEKSIGLWDKFIGD